MRDHKAEVGSRALLGLIRVLQDDADIGLDMGKAVLETVNVLCEVDDAPKEKEHEKVGIWITSSTVNNHRIHCLQ